MLCCVGLIAGMSVGQSLGGPWTYIAPAAGFGIGFLGDMKLMKGMHKKAAQPDAALRPEPSVNPMPTADASVGKAQLTQQPSVQSELTPGNALGVPG